MFGRKYPNIWTRVVSIAVYSLRLHYNNYYSTKEYTNY